MATTKPRSYSGLIQSLKSRTDFNAELVAPIAEFKQLVATNPVLSSLAQEMFTEAKSHKDLTPLNGMAVSDFNEFLVLLNQIMTQAPEYTEYFDPKEGALEPYGLIGFPINALLDWPMATDAGNIFLQMN